MSNASISSGSKGGGAGRFLLWLALALTAALLSFVTATAVRNNPIYSNRDAYGISKYHLIEQCREGMHDAMKLQTATGPAQTAPLGQLLQQAQPPLKLTPNQELVAETAASPREIDQAAAPDAQGQLQMLLPVRVGIRSKDTGAFELITNGTLQCLFDKNKKALTTTLYPGQ